MNGMTRSEHTSNEFDVVALHSSYTTDLHACDSAVSDRSSHLLCAESDFDQAYTYKRIKSDVTSTCGTSSTKIDAELIQQRHLKQFHF